jgi:23S rRNA (uracil1939-C5)-methyltransferase
MKKMIEKTVTMDALTSQGFGAAGSLEVPKTLPQEEVLVQLKKRHRGEMLSVLKPSPLRVSPKCVHFPICGGCKVQQMDYEAQIKWKEEKVKAAFPGVQVFPIIASLDVFEWRNKMEFTFSSDKAGQRYLGLIMQEGRAKVFNIERCHLAKPWMSEILGAVRHWWEKEGLTAYKHSHNQGTLRTLCLREGMTTADRMVILHVSGNPEDAMSQQHIQSFKETVLKFTPEGANLSVFILIQQSIPGQQTEFFEMHLAGSDMIRERLENKLFLISPRSFFQPNTKQAAILYHKGLELLALKGTETVYDLYCGTATLGLFASAQAKQVIGVEISKEACLDANQNIAINKIENMTIYNGDVSTILKGDFPAADVVMVDPPRTGLSKEAIVEIIKLKPTKILYISCNFLTCANNVLDFIQAGYHLKIVQPIDQFPHTYHVEVIALLTKEPLNAI